MSTRSVPFTTNASRMQAVLTRNVNAAGCFVFAVTTTGVFCRPGCPSRIPKPENVRLFDTSTLAVRAGFRPCKRCRPDLPHPALDTTERIAASCRRIESAEEPPSLQELADAVGMSRFHFLRRFKEVTGTTPKAFAMAIRAARTRQELSKAHSVTEAIYQTGHNSSGRFYESTAALLGMLPATYQAGGSGEQIEFAIGECSLGAVLVASTTKGLCAVLLGDDAELLIREVCERFPKARLRPGDAAFRHRAAQVITFVDEPTVASSLPLDLRGTLFQQQVWRALQRLPPGETLTYSELAKRLGRPNAVRAVARACAANTLAVIVPCHRIVRRDGGLAGYRWGVDRKRALLLRERLLAQRP